MATKVDQTPAVEPRRPSAMTTTSAASTTGPKVSMFGAKTGFVIPKNKLSGSLVPIFRGGAKLEGNNDAAKEESAKQVQRKTKWGIDLTQDAAVRRGRALAYQTRVEQITKQLKSGILETKDAKDDQGLQPPSEVSNRESSSQINSEPHQLELLELERRDAIGEILKLNPSYKAPPDYKPLMKEATVPIPIKGYNLIGILLGPGSNTQKRLEEETGAKIRVHGTKAGTQEKGEVILSDENEVQSAYEELFVLVSADTFEKVDAAVSLIELLVKPVPANPVISTAPTSVSADSVNVVDQSQTLSTGYLIPVTGVHQGVMQPLLQRPQPGPPYVFPTYPNPWFSLGPPQPSGFTRLPNSTGPILTNPVRFPPSPLNPSNMPPFFGARPPPGAVFASVPTNSPLVNPRFQPGMQVTHQTYLPSNNHPILGQRPLQANPTPPIPSSGNQHTLTGPAQVPRPPFPSMPQPLSTPPPVPLPNRPLTSPVSSTGWSTGSTISPIPGNMMHMTSQTSLPQRPHPVIPQHPVAPLPPAANMFSSSPFPSRPSSFPIPNAPTNHSAAPPVFVSAPSQVGPTVASVSTTSLPPLHSPGARPLPSSPSTFPQAARASPGSAPPPPVQSPSPGPIPSSNPVVGPPQVIAPKPPRPSSGDFTFQPRGPHHPPSPTVPRPNNQSIVQNTPLMPPNPTIQPPPAPQAPSFRPVMRNLTPQPNMQGFPRSPGMNQSTHPPSPNSGVPFAGNPTIPLPPRHQPFQNINPVLPPSPVLQMGPRPFSSAPQMPNLAGPLPPRPSPLQLPQNRPVNHLVSPSRGHQIYDPFSPTSVASTPPQGDSPAKARKQENDPEYEDLMASVGVK